MGVGTLTFYNPISNVYAALGHGISDYDLKELIDVDTGTLNIASVIDITKGEKNSPGEIKGLLNDKLKIGTIEKNNCNGIYGKFCDNDNYFRDRKELLIASKNEIKTGSASVICTVEENRRTKRI